MFSFFKKRSAQTFAAKINGQDIDVSSGETLLAAALRAHIDFPHSCRVGGCAACKCRLVSGKVRELTDNSYILSDRELDQGMILACQAVPQSDLVVEVDMTTQRQRQTLEGRIVGQEKLTHDITRLTVQMNASLPFKAGQYANLELDSMPGVKRSYSFASAPAPDGSLAFFVRKVPGGQFSSAVNDTVLHGQGICIDGPLGDFYLRPSDAPLLLIAGGSGLAPVMAILEQALVQKVRRPVRLLFGARSQNDLYALKEIEHIEAHWPASFDFNIALSEEPSGSDWFGFRGFVTELLPLVFIESSDAYLCGPPAMIDSAEAALKKAGLHSDHIYCDRFVTQSDTVPA